MISSDRCGTGRVRARDPEAIAEYSKQNPERKIRVRIGLNTGES